jgi:presenilin-like A22 family membrane protease
MRLLPGLSLAGMGIFLLAVQLLALWMAKPFVEEVPPELQAFEDPGEILNIGWILAMIAFFTMLFLLLIKFQKRWVLKLVIFLTIGMVLFYGFTVFFNFYPAIFLSLLLVFLLYRYPEWWVIDVLALPIGAFAAWVFGISLQILPVMIFLIAVAAYDFISVYRTGHMVTLAEGVMDLRIPILFVLPKRRGYSFLEEKELGEDAYYMGLGDAIIPAILVVSANLPSVNSFLSGAIFIGWLSFPALFAMAGTLVGFGVLSFLIGKGKPHAGLPFLNTGTIAGFLLGCFLSGVWIF